MSAFTVIVRAHDLVWKDRAALDLRQRIAVCQMLWRAAIYTHLERL